MTIGFYGLLGKGFCPLEVGGEFLQGELYLEATVRIGRHLGMFEQECQAIGANLESAQLLFAECIHLAALVSLASSSELC